MPQHDSAFMSGCSQACLIRRQHDSAFMFMSDCLQACLIVRQQ